PCLREVRPRALYRGVRGGELAAGLEDFVLRDELLRQQRLDAVNVLPGVRGVGLSSSQCRLRSSDGFLERADLDAREAELRLRLVQRALVGPGVDDEEELPSMDALVVDNGKLDQRPADLGRDTHAGCAHVGVVCARIGVVGPPDDEAEDQGRQDREHAQQPSGERLDAPICHLWLLGQCGTKKRSQVANVNVNPRLRYTSGSGRRWGSRPTAASAKRAATVRRTPTSTQSIQPGKAAPANCTTGAQLATARTGEV